MLLLRFIHSILLLSQLVLGAQCAMAQTYPARPIHINTGGTGSAGDLVSRLLAPKLADSLGQQVLVENRPSGPILGGLVAKAAADGYTLLVSGNSFWLLPYFQADLSWDPAKDFAPVSLLTASPSVLVVHPSVPANSVRELIAYAKARPGKVHWASGPLGTANHLAGEMFKIMAGVNVVRVPYKGVGQALNDLIGGQVEMMFPIAGGMTPHLKAGRLRALAVSSAAPSALAPGLPTVAASGVPGFESVSIVGMFTPAKTSAAIISRLSQEVQIILHTADVRERLLGTGVEPQRSSPEQLAATVQSDIALVGRIIRETGIKPE